MFPYTAYNIVDNIQPVVSVVVKPNVTLSSMFATDLSQPLSFTLMNQYSYGFINSDYQGRILQKCLHDNYLYQHPAASAVGV
jgi:hypothetical protein